MLKHWIRFAILICMLLPAEAALACSCDWGRTGLTAKDSRRKARAVFVGEVISVLPRETRDPVLGKGYLLVEFRVEKYWKGVKKDVIEVLALHPAACGGPTYTVGERYLVYAYKYEKHLETSGCARSRRIQDAHEDLAALGKAKAPKTRKP